MRKDKLLIQLNAFEYDWFEDMRFEFNIYDFNPTVENVVGENTVRKL